MDTKNMIKLAEMFLEGRKILQNTDKAIFWYKKARQKATCYLMQDLTAAALAKIFRRKGDLQEALSWYKRICFISTADIKEVFKIYIDLGETDEAISYLTHKADKDIQIQAKLGKMLYKGDIVSKNYKEAFVRLNKAAKQGIADSQFLLGEMYRNGLHIEEDLEEALFWYQQAIRQNHQLAVEAIEDLSKNKSIKHLKENYSDQYRIVAREIGLLYFHDNDLIKNPEHEKCKYWLELAAEGEYGDMKAEYYLGVIYNNGDIADRSKRRSYDWHMKAARKGHRKSKYIVGATLLQSECKKEQSFGLQNLLDAGCIDSKRKIAESYKNGRGVEVDLEKALEYYTLAVSEGCLHSKYDLILTEKELQRQEVA